MEKVPTLESELRTLVDYGETEYQMAKVVCENIAKTMAAALTAETKEMKDTLKSVCKKMVDSTIDNL